jgi:hypothetical protein
MHISDAFSSEDSLYVRKVKTFAFPEVPESIAMCELSFDTFTVRIAVQSDDDTLAFSRHGISDEDRGECSVEIADPFWDPYLGWSLYDAWHMTNKQGYHDAVEVRLRERTNEGPFRLIRMEAVASAINIHEMAVVRAAGRTLLFEAEPQDGGASERDR